MPDKTKRRWFVGLLIWTLLCGAGWAQVRDSENLRLVVNVYDDAGLPFPIVMRAEQEAHRVFQAARIDVIWQNPAFSVDADPLRARASESLQISVRIVRRSHQLPEEILGMAFLDEDGLGQQADLFYDGIAKLTARDHGDPSDLLGAVMAHELGHLLLGTNSHTPNGIMRKHWDQGQLRMAALAELYFDAEQTTRMRKRLNAAIGRENRTLRASASK